MRTLAILLLSVGWTACAGDQNKTASPENTPSPDSTVQQVSVVDTALTGSWELEALPQSAYQMKTLYPRQKALINIQPEFNEISGSTGCNRFGARFRTSGDDFFITEFSSSTLSCVGNAEKEFMTAMNASKRYQLTSDKKLIWRNDSITWAVFRKKDLSAPGTK